MLKNVYEGINSRSEVYFSKMYPTCVSSKVCELVSAKFTLILVPTRKRRRTTTRREKKKAPGTNLGFMGMTIDL